MKKLIRWSFIISVIVTIAIYVYALDVNSYVFSYGVLALLLLTVLITFLNHYFFFPRFSNRKKVIFFALTFVISFAISTYVNYVISFWFYNSYQPSIGTILGLARMHFFIHTLFTALYITEQYLISERQKNQLLNEKINAELSLLKYQVNPHFLFNTLNNIYSSALSENSPMTAESILKLSGLMRYMLYESEEEKVLITEEITYLEDFVNLNRLRISEEYQMEVSFLVKGDQYEEKRIAPMILIPFIENAFKHGISLQIDSFIDIKLYISVDTLNLIVSNTIKPSNQMIHVDKKNSGVGLENVEKRLQLIYPDQYKLDVIERAKTYSVNLEIQI
ncbi:MAG: histidine kinase [Bacteroidota bacterium]